MTANGEGGFFKYFFFIILIVIFPFWLCQAACGILVSQPETEPVPPTLEVWSPNHWKASEVPGMGFLFGVMKTF